MPILSRYSLVRLSVVLAVSAALTVTSFAATGVAFLKIPNGSAEIALGEAGVSQPFSPASSVWNPALLGNGEGGLGIQFFHWLGDGNGLFGSVVFPTRWGGFGGYIFDLSTPDIEVRNQPGEAVGTFTAHQSIIGVSAGARMPYDLNVGASLKGYLDEIYGSTVDDYPILDAGMSWKKGSWAAGASVANIGLADNSPAPLPRIKRVGGSYSGQVENLDYTGLVEYSKTTGEVDLFHCGVQLKWQNLISLRGGWVGGSGVSRPSFGLGFVVGVYTIDTALTLQEKGLGTTWRAGVGMNL